MLGPQPFRGPTLETLARKDSPFANALVVTSTFSGLAQDKILVLTNMSGAAQPGAGTGVTQVEIHGFGAAGTAFNIYRKYYAATDDVDVVFNWQGEIMVRGRGTGNDTLICEATFDLATASNVLRFSYMGYIIPRANVAEY